MASLGDIVGPRPGVGAFDVQVHAPVTRGYRRALALALAVGLHLILLGLGAWVSLPMPSTPSTPEPPSLDVVLVSRPAAEPERALAIAEAAQQAARVEAPPAPDAAPPSEATPEPAERTTEQAAAPSPEPVAEPEPALEPSSDPEPAPEAPALSGRELAASATASLRERDFAMNEPAAELADRSQQAARQAAEARYVDAWTRRVQDFGNRFYPAPPDLDGQLKLRVVIDHQGKLLQVEVVQSSGHPELDQAALNTIRGAAPYRPFDQGMAGLDRLSISRVWRFGTGNDFGVR
ncbi:TonB family protein [Halomonas sp. YLGW01]|uniref:energy transducer TonB n=1 Tax=Halomonas sp. YLGW01 TaxID=2773308 RepID=UPI001786749F|nr:TonB family protein [Halomonas sp. YLGW01]